MVNGKGVMFDNNSETTFVIPLYDKKGKVFDEAGVIAAQLTGGYAPYLFKIKPPHGYATGLYAAEFKKMPALKEKYYAGYLQLLYPQNKDSARPVLVAYAKQQFAKKTTEEKWLSAQNLYRQMGMTDEVTQAETKILAAYPKGQLAKSKFYNKLYADKEPSAEKYLAAMHEYAAKFGDSSAATKDNFYRMIVSYYADKKDWANVDKYSAYVTDKIQLAAIYNNAAWSLSGQQLYNEGTQLEYAAGMSRKSLQAVKEKIDDPKATADARKNWQATFGLYADTYALILYKLNKADSAFYYENAIDKTTFDDGEKERYAMYAQKAKGAAFARKYIEEQLLSGVNSPGMQKQLQGIYTELNLPQDEYERIKQQAITLAKQKALNKIKETLGDLKAKDFTLKDLDGNEVSLASFRNKVVVLDFWATWCGPCRASFPAMQEAVNKYKNDKDVVFLFMDISENGDEATVRKNTARFIADNKYTFHVLLDIDNKVAPDYKVDFIPDKFIINRDGNITFMGNELTDIDAAIADAKS
jgi:thiol-disulfide isomerase/thioredoxin